MDRKDLENRIEVSRRSAINPVDIVKISLEDNGMRKTIASAYMKLLKIYNYNISAIIRYLQIPRQTFYNKLEQYSIDIKELRKLR